MEELAIFSTLGIGSITLVTLIPAILVLIVCLVAIKMIMGIVNRMLEKSPLERSLHTFIRSAINIALYVLTVLIVADKLGIPVTSLVAALSVFGLAVSLAVQGSLSNLAGGIMILVSKPFVIGDFVEAGGISGTVLEIGLVYTKIATGDNKVINCPNSEISATKIINYTSGKNRRVDITIGASYNAPTKTVFDALLKCAARHEDDMIAENAPFVAVSAYKDSCIEYILRVWVPAEKYWDIYFALMQEVREEFDAASVEMTYPHMNVHILEK